MEKKLAVLGVIMALFVSVGISQATDGFGTVSGDCNSVTIEWGPEGFGGSYDISIINMSTGDPFWSSGWGEGSGGSHTHVFDPPLTEDTSISISGSINNSEFIWFAFPFLPQLILECPEVVSPVGSSSESRTELCDDGRTNITLCEPLAIYPVITDDGVSMAMYWINRGSNQGIFELYVSAEDLNALPVSTNTVCTIDRSDNGLVVAYLLPSGEIQVNAGPDDEGKFFVYRYATFPSVPTIETYIGTSETVYPSC